MKKSEFIYRGKNLGLEKLKILELAYDDIEDHDILYAIIDNKGELIDATDWIGEALEIIAFKDSSEELKKELLAPWHIKIVWANTYKDISKSRFRKLFGDALLLEHREKRKSE